MKYRVKVTENGKSWLLPHTYTEEEAEFEIQMQEELNRVNAILGEAPAKFDLIPV